MRTAPRELRRPLAHSIGANKRRADYAPAAVKGTSVKRGLHQKRGAVVRHRQHNPRDDGKNDARHVQELRNKNKSPALSNPLNRRPYRVESKVAVRSLSGLSHFAFLVL
jgi:hypothetical protein